MGNSRNPALISGIQRPVMRLTLITLLILLLLAATTSTPACEITCALAQNGTAAGAAFSAGLPGLCHESANEAGSGGAPESEHPCKKGVHHAGALSAPPARSSYVTIGINGVLSGEFYRIRNDMILPRLAARSDPGEILFLPLPSIALSLLLRI